MTRQPALIACLTLAASLSPLPALANPTNPAESSSFYGNVRNWLIEVLQQDGQFVGCRGTIPLQAAGPLLIERRGDMLDGWAMYVPTEQAPSTAYGASVSGHFAVDAERIPVGFEIYRGGWAEVSLTGEMRQQMMDGNYVTTAPEGEEERQWILNGSTAALEVLEECYARQGANW
ncbi:hypothetical protein [Pararhodobacter sp. CCB-MM2]|uniref:hypothetical protein n=1 Tax=Pararhodobacter sp. CCB-MM2 TaxID=1786003 RepID=UPI000832C9D5|nr:hypothetical protein [Pararhodobacter sp. CCB-MM2]